MSESSITLSGWGGRCYEANGMSVHYFGSGATCQCGGQPTVSSVAPTTTVNRPDLRIVEGGKGQDL
jgi:hypothetical protein